MPTNEERREAARKLRAVAGNHREVDKEYVHDILGLYMGECVDGYDPLSVMKVADLIEPDSEIDRDALLKLANELEQETGSVCGVCTGKTASRIREACGYYKPKVDRDALLYLAQDLEVSVIDSGACGDVVGIVMDIVAKIRKACGEIE